MSRFLAFLLISIFICSLFSEEVLASSIDGVRVDLVSSDGQVLDSQEISKIEIDLVKKRKLGRRPFYWGVGNFGLLGADGVVIGGVQNPSKSVQFELFSGVMAARLVAKGVVDAPYGARLRYSPFRLKSGRRIYAEIAAWEYVRFNKDNEGGELTDNVYFGVSWETARKNLWSVGYLDYTHHAWRRESHDPEDSNGVAFGYTHRFKP